MTTQYDFDCFVDSLFLSLRALFITSTTTPQKQKPGNERDQPSGEVMITSLWTCLAGVWTNNSTLTDTLTLLVVARQKCKVTLKFLVC